jgi:ADP-heptose:LPS heptosyltransferase
MPIEITKKINKYKFLGRAANSFLKFAFYFVRLICKTFSIKDGNIVIISLNRLGDTVFTIPAIKEVQKFYKRRLTIFCYSESVPIYNLRLDNVDFCTIGHKDFFFNRRIANRKVRKALKALRPEILFDLSGMMTSASVIFNSRAKKIIGMNREQFKTIYDNYVPIRTKPHLTETYIDVAAAVIPNIEREQIKIFPSEINREGKIIIHPFGGWKAKEWNLNKFVELAIRFKKNYDVCLISPEEKIPEDIISLLEKEKVIFIQTNTVQELITEIERCSVFIGNDSGPLYIASLLGKPTFTIYGPTNPEFSSPLGEYHRNIKKMIKCSPQIGEQYCFTNGGRFGCPAFQCMNLLELEEVFLNVLPFVQKYCNPKINVI